MNTSAPSSIRTDVPRFSRFVFIIMVMLPFHSALYAEVHIPKNVYARIRVLHRQGAYAIAFVGDQVILKATAAESEPSYIIANRSPLFQFMRGERTGCSQFVRDPSNTWPASNRHLGINQAICLYSLMTNFAIYFADPKDGTISYGLYPSTPNNPEKRVYLTPTGDVDFYVFDYSNDLGVIRREFDRAIKGRLDGRIDEWMFFDPARFTGNKRCITKIEFDENANGRVDKWDFYENCKLVREEVDANENGTKETIRYYDPNKTAEYNAPIRTVIIGGENQKKAAEALEAKSYQQAIILYQAANQELVREWGQKTEKICWNLVHVTESYFKRPAYAEAIRAANLIKDAPGCQENYFMYTADKFAYSALLMLNNYAAAKSIALSLESRFPDGYDGHTPTLYYNIGCIFSKEGNIPKALEYLRKAFVLDKTLLPEAQEDADLAPVRRDPGFAKLLKQYQ